MQQPARSIPFRAGGVVKLTREASSRYGLIARKQLEMLIFFAFFSGELCYFWINCTQTFVLCPKDHLALSCVSVMIKCTTGCGEPMLREEVRF